MPNSSEQLKFLTNVFGVNPQVGKLLPFTYIGKSNDDDSGPFVKNPQAAFGTLLFDPSVSVRGTFFVLGFESESLNNYSYYLFDSRKFDSREFAFDTLGITDIDGGQPKLKEQGPLLGFAALYVRLQPQAGAVPEPTGVALIAAAFGALALTTRRRRGS